MATTYHQRPSSLIGVADPYLAYCVDEMALMVGAHPEPEKKEVVLKTFG